MKKTLGRILVLFLALVIFSVSGFSNSNQAHGVKHSTVHGHHKSHHKKHHKKGHSHKKHSNKRR